MRVHTSTSHLPIEFRTDTSYVLPNGIASVRTFDDPTIAVEAHCRMQDRFNEDAHIHAEQYEG